jgi:hypothetical protein
MMLIVDSADMYSMYSSCAPSAESSVILSVTKLSRVSLEQLGDDH